jgi:hypothetical protein
LGEVIRISEAKDSPKRQKIGTNKWKFNNMNSADENKCEKVSL